MTDTSIHNAHHDLARLHPSNEREAVKAILATLANDSYQRGRHDALNDLIPTDVVAATLGISASRVRRLATTYAIGWRVGDRCWLFQSADTDRLRQHSTGKPGRPKR